MAAAALRMNSKGPHPLDQILTKREGCEGPRNERARVKTDLAHTAREHARFRVHLTPTSASRLNLLERVFRALPDQWIMRQSASPSRALRTSPTIYGSKKRNQSPIASTRARTNYSTPLAGDSEADQRSYESLPIRADS